MAEFNVYRYETSIYPLDILVCKVKDDKQVKKLNKNFKYNGGGSLDLSMDEFSAVTCYYIDHPKIDKLAILVVLTKESTINDCAHEAYHAASRILNAIHQCKDDAGEECIAYMVGTFASWFYEVLTDKKVKKAKETIKIK